jgi:photosystem II stability/assembly factor-like uncharacterized protein
MKSFCYTILFFFSPMAFLYPQWRLANGTEGIRISDVEIYYSDPDSVYALGNGLMLSTDRGENWVTIGTRNAALEGTSGAVFKIDPFDSKRMYLNHSILPFDGNEVKMTTDAGLNWETLFTGHGPPWIDQPIVEIDPVDLTTVYVTVNYHKLYKSSDHGNSWDSVPPPNGYSFSSLAISPSDNNILYIGCTNPNQIYKSTDRANTWTLLPLQIIGDNPINNIVVDPEDANIVYASVFSYGGPPGGIYKTINGGLSWEEKNNGLTNNDWDVHAFVIDPKNPDELYIGTGGEINIFKSTDGGEEWREFDNGLPQIGHTSSIAIDTLNNRVYIGRSNGIYIYDNMTNVDDKTEERIIDFLLYQNYPNPFNSRTEIQYYLPEGVNVLLSLYNILGEEIVNLVNEYQSEGSYSVELDMNGFTSGIYYYQIRVGGFSKTMKMIYLK